MGLNGTLIPAYGRDYKNKKDVEKDFRAGKDFKLMSPFGSCYCSIRDAEKGEHVQIRYNNLRSVIVVTV